MAHSIQNVAERSAIFNDSDLLILVCMMITRIKHQRQHYPSLQKLANQWSADQAGWGPGCIELNLEGVNDHESRIGEFLVLLSEVRRELSSFGPAMPATRLNECSLGRSIVFRSDYPTDPLKDALDKLRRLVLGEEGDRQETLAE